MVNCNADTSKGEIKTKLKIGNYFYITLEEEIILTKTKEESFLDNVNTYFRIRIVENKYDEDFIKEEMIDSLKRHLPEKATLIEMPKGDLEYYGYYEYVVTREDEYHSFVGEVYGKEASILLMFYFDDIKWLEKARNIWMSCSDK